MKVAMVTPYLPPRLGGREFWVWWMTQELVKKGVEVVIFTSNVRDYHNASSRNETTRENGVTIHRMGVWRDIDKYSTPVLCPSFRLFRQENPDIVHLHEPNLFLTTPLALYAKCVLRKKVVTHCYSDPFDWYKRGRLFRLAMMGYGWLYDLKLRISDRIIVLSDGYLRQSRYLSRYKAKTVVMPMCLAPVFHALPMEEVSRFKRETGLTGLKVVLYVGRLDHRKGIDYLLQAMKQVDAVCVIVGKGEKSVDAYLRALAKDLGLGDRARFAGMQSQEDLNRYYNACDVLVLPTSDETAETFGAVLLEAWAGGKPVISVDNPAPAALIDAAKGGLLARREDADDLGRTINRLLGDGSLARELGENGREYVQRTFSFKEVGERLVQLYEGLLV